MKPITISNEFKQKLIADFTSYIDSVKTLEGGVNYRFDMEKCAGTKPLIPVIFFTPEARAKMNILVQESPEEVAWHGLVTKLPEPGTYLVEDIIVYPQEVSGASVYTDQAEYEKWITDLPDEQFHKLRMQGHSHVNMSVSPSSTDTKLYTDMLKTLTKIPFYIFMIVNKHDDMFILLYDFEQNIIFETKETLVETLLSDNTSLSAWRDEAVSVVRKEKPRAALTSGYTNTNTYAQQAVSGNRQSQWPGYTPAEKNNLARTGARAEQDDEEVYFRQRWGR